MCNLYVEVYWVGVSPPQRMLSYLRFVFLDTFVKFRQAIVNFMSVCPQGAARLSLNVFWWNLIFEGGFFFGKFVEKTQVASKSVTNDGYFTWRRWIIIKMGSVSGKRCRENKTHFVRWTVPPPPLKSRRPWGNVEKYGGARQATDDGITRRMRFACWTTKATHTHTENI